MFYCTTQLSGSGGRSNSRSNKDVCGVPYNKCCWRIPDQLYLTSICPFFPVDSFLGATNWSLKFKHQSSTRQVNLIWMGLNSFNPCMSEGKWEKKWMKWNSCWASLPGIKKEAKRILNFISFNSRITRRPSYLVILPLSDVIMHAFTINNYFATATQKELADETRESIRLQPRMMMERSATWVIKAPPSPTSWRRNEWLSSSSSSPCAVFRWWSSDTQ